LSIGPVIRHFRFRRRLANSPPQWEFAVVEKGKSFQEVVVWRQEFCGVEALRVMDGDSFRQLYAHAGGGRLGRLLPFLNLLF
jgi:hypothetical protein